MEMMMRETMAVEGATKGALVEVMKRGCRF
jgi:hypothetical protein